MDARAAHEESVRAPEAFWRREAERLTWFHPPHAVLDSDLEEVDFSWFPGGRLNVTHNCVDRHAAVRPSKTALVWVGNDGRRRSFTYRQVKHEVGRIANTLRAHGVRKGDRVCLSMGVVPDTVFAMLACARIGAIHVVVFSGFSAEALRERILDAGAQVVITQNEAPRGRRTIPLKSVLDHALEGVDSVKTVLVVRRTGKPVPMKAGRDFHLDEETVKHRATCPVEWMASEDPLFILYTSGTTGRPKGVMHTTAGYLLWAALTHEAVFGADEDSVHLCTADLGWITGHGYSVYGPLANGVTTVIHEGPPSSALFHVVDELKVTSFYTAPTALRMMMAEGDQRLASTSRASLRVLGSVGEPISPEVWRWYHDVVGQGRCKVFDTWWQTETGGIAIAPFDVDSPKPGAAMRPFFGIDPVLVDDDGRILDGPEVTGNLCLARPWPGQARTLWGDHRHYHQAYYGRFASLFFTGDRARRDADGDLWILGRVDDVLAVSGHRLGSAEIEGALAAHEAVSEAAVVGVPHPIKGTSIFAFVTVRPDAWDGSPEQLAAALREQVRHAIGAIASPDDVRVVDALPKTRSGKIVRRLLRTIATGGSDFGDLATLADPSVLEPLTRRGPHGP